MTSKVANITHANMSNNPETNAFFKASELSTALLSRLFDAVELGKSKWRHRDSVFTRTERANRPFIICRIRAGNYLEFLSRFRSLGPATDDENATESPQEQ